MPKNPKGHTITSDKIKEIVEHMKKYSIPSIKCHYSDYSKPAWAVDQITRASGLVEDVCEHGVGHPNSDWLSRNNASHLSIHGCDGCCCSPEEAA